MHKIIAVTPAGRKRYLEILSRYVLRDDAIVEWHLWDNCRDVRDRRYLSELQQFSPKVRLQRINNPSGTNGSINHFYRFTRDPNAFYIRLDDDIVYLPPNFAGSIYRTALADKARHLWWSGLVVNNAVCSWLLGLHGVISTSHPLSAAALDPIGWRSGAFAAGIHGAFLDLLEGHRGADIAIPNAEVSCGRFSVNCISFFGSDARDLGEKFCPLGVDEEEWISAVLPVKTGRPGCVVGSLPVAHFSFFTQEEFLLRKDILARYGRLVGVRASTPAALKLGNAPGNAPLRRVRTKVKLMILERLLTGPETPWAKFNIPAKADRIDQAGSP